MPINYVGRTTNFKGKTMWEILGNLKNFGIGRILVRSMFERYPEPSYLKIVKVETLPGENIPVGDYRKVRVWVEKTFRGVTHPKLIQMESTTYKPDYRLLPKAEEKSYCQCKTPYEPNKILPSEFKFPPLLEEFIVRDKKLKGEEIPEKLSLDLKYCFERENRTKLESDTQKSNIDFSHFGKPASPNLYKDVL